MCVLCACVISNFLCTPQLNGCFPQMAQPPLKRHLVDPDTFYSSDSRSSLDDEDDRKLHMLQCIGDGGVYTTITNTVGRCI